ncbi:MAG TPA: cbb3-type cytochrome c oxidase subunit I [Candidatus Saccharimonadales bacterium]
MNDILQFIFGRMSLEYLPSEPATIGAAIGMPLGLLAVVAALTYFKKWKWLWQNYITSLDAKKIGIMYVIVSLLMLTRGVADAFMLRSHTAVSVGDQSGPFSTDTFQQVFTAHGTIMIFFVAMGLVFGLINIALPLMIGARDVAYPFLNSVSFWLFAGGMVLVNTALIFGGFSAGGWLGYPPLTGLEYNPGPGVDYWIWSLQIAGVGSLLSGINFFVTIIKCRAPGMTLMKMPIFVWSVLVTTVLVMLAFPLLTGTLAMLSLDRLMDMHFFTSTAGGNPMMYINLIWAWGHPEVYILVLPAFGIFSEVVATFARKAIFGYTTMVAALIAIMFFSFIVWQHHFFTMGAGANVNAFFGIMTMIIAIPTGVKIFNWLFTMYRGRIRFDAPMWWFMAFIFTFTIGGVTGVLMAVPALDFQVHNTMFLVAHFHNTIIGGVLFGLFAGLTYWFPKMFGFKLHDGLGKISAVLWQIGFLLAFMPLYALGLMGAVRRIDHYTDPTWQPFFIVSAIGVMTIGAGIFAMILQLGWSIKNRKKLRDTTGDPWNGRTLEWSVPSPAPHYSFATIPEVTVRDQFWHDKQAGKKAKLSLQDIELPKNSPLGLYIALAAGMVGFGLIWHMWWLVGVAFVTMIVFIAWRTLDDNSEYTLKKSELEAEV